jgi:type IV pilus assembly protein PilW
MNVRAASRGLTLVELLVAMSIGLVMALAATQVIVQGMRGKRVTVSVNDVNQTAAFLSTTLDRVVRGAGAGFAMSAQVLGCPLRAGRDGATLWPRASGWPAPFATLPVLPRLAPVVVHAGASAAGSDVLVVMAGNAGIGDAPTSVQPASATASSVRLSNTHGFMGDDLVLVQDAGLGCLLEQVGSGFTGGTAQTLTFGGRYAEDAVDGVELAWMGTSAAAQVIRIGQAAALNTPEFQFIGVGANNTLFTYDLMRLGPEDAANPIAEGVIELRAIYGIDSNGDNTLDTWVRPDASPWTAAELTNGTAVSQANLRRIFAVRLGLLLRSAVQETEDVAPASVLLFRDLSNTVQRTITIASANRRFRHRSVELTIPVRNVLPQ